MPFGGTIVRYSSARPSNHMIQPTYFVHQLLRPADWQHRAQLDLVCEWWRGCDGTSGQGICSLIGIGGAGKTAIADRFLQLLPNVLPPDSSNPKDGSLHTPASVFVFSFYDASDPQVFLQALSRWLYPVSNPQSDGSMLMHSHDQLVHALQNAPVSLLVLDGLEKIQEDATRGGILGRISDGNIRELVIRLSSGYLPRVSALITSRFPLTDLDEALPTYYRPIDVEEIDINSGINLLRRGGVYGSDSQLAHIVQRCGCHALTVDLAGGLIHEFHDGDPNTELEIGSQQEIERIVENEQDPKRRAARKKELQFAKVASHYRAALRERDNVALVLLELVCLFRLGVEVKMLATVYDAITSQPGSELSKLAVQDLRKKLNVLVRMRLLANRGEQYTIHPAIRDGFLTGVADSVKRIGHETARKALAANLSTIPGEVIADSEMRDVLEEIVHHTLEAGYVDEAWDVYWHRLGNFQILGMHVGDLERGERICGSFFSGASPTLAAKRLQALVSSGDHSSYSIAASRANEWASYLSKLGQMDSAIALIDAAHQSAAASGKMVPAAISLVNLADFYFRCGRIPQALQYSEFGDKTGESYQAQGVRANAQFWIAMASSYSGDIRKAEEHFEKSLDFQSAFESFAEDRQLWSTRGIGHALHLLTIGRHKQAAKINEENLSICQSQSLDAANDIDIQECLLVEAALLLRQHRLSEALKHCEEARKCAERQGERRNICWAHLVLAKIHLAQLVGNPQIGSGDIASEAKIAISRGLKDAIDSGFGLLHIDLLLTRALFHLLNSKPTEALADITVALDDGRPANPSTGQPELLPARSQDCGYPLSVTTCFCEMVGPSITPLTKSMQKK